MPDRVKVNESGFRTTFETQKGPIGQDLWVRAGRVEKGAKVKVGKKTRALQKSIHREFIGRTAKSKVGVKIGSSLPHAELHHRGTGPHTILPRSNGPMRVVSGGRVTFANVVHHPGTAPNPYLTTSLPLAGGKSRA